jgi:glycosyltransferase involved in cell wall biosynthesis
VATGGEGVSDKITTGAGEIVSPENDPAALAAVLRGYAEDPARRLREGEQGRRQAVAAYDAATVAEQTERLFRTTGAR